MASANASGHGDGDQHAYDEPVPFGTMEATGPQKIALKAVAFSGDIEGLLFSYSIRQEYQNETKDNLEIIYTFPVGWNTALLGMKANIGGKELKGEVVEKSEAEESYEKAIFNGDSAIMVQKSSMGLYTANLGNIKSGERVVVEIHCAQLLSYVDGHVRLCIPTVIGARYGDPYCPGGLSPHESAAVDENANYPVQFELTLRGDIAKGKVICPTHAILTDRLQDSLRITLQSGALLDRDFVLLMEGVARSHALAVRDESGYMVAASFAPEMPAKEISPIGLKILVDCSGSMSGESIAQAQKGLGAILPLLSAGDYVSYSKFGSSVCHMTKSLVPCGKDAMQRLASLIDATEADMGGTEMEEALLSTFSSIAAPEGLPAVILLITDGMVWDVKNVISAARASGHRIFAIGVSSEPAESLLRELAEQTGGACELVTPNENMAAAIIRMFSRMRGQIATSIRVDWHGKELWQSAPPRFIYNGETVHCFALLKSLPESGPTLHWEADKQPYSAQCANVESCDQVDLARMGRMREIDESRSKKKKLELALKYQLVSDLTSLILVYERDEKIKGLPKIQHVPQMEPHGHGCFAQEIVVCCELESAEQTKEFPIWTLLKEDIPGKADKRNMRLIQQIVAFWKTGIYKWVCPEEFMDEVQNNGAMQPVTELISRIAGATGIPAEVVWGVFIRWALSKCGGSLQQERHSVRLLNLFHPAEPLEIYKIIDEWLGEEVLVSRL